MMHNVTMLAGGAVLGGAVGEYFGYCWAGAALGLISALLLTLMGSTGP